MVDRDIHIFDKTLSVTYSETRIEELKAQHSDLYENHLQIALQLEQWAQDGMEQGTVKDYLSPEKIEGWRAALLEVSTLLRRGDYAPGGGMLPPRRVTVRSRTDCEPPSRGWG